MDKNMLDIGLVFWIILICIKWTIYIAWITVALLL